MDRSLQISLPAEMKSPEVKVIFRILGKGNVRFVGGCVRNALLGIPIGDIDLATPLLPQNVTDRFLKNKVKVVPTGLAHGTVTAVINGKSFEITTLRIDEKTDGRHAEVLFSTSWEADAARRDFTMNALYADLDGGVYDPLGRGLADLEKRRVVFVGDPERRIREDYLRILRFFRFSLYYGGGKLDRAGATACQKLARGLSRLSRERVSQEFFKILSHSKAEKILGSMLGVGILKSLFSKNFDPSCLSRLVSVQGDDTGDAALVARLVLVSGSSAKVDKWLILNRKQKSVLEKLSSVRINTIRIDPLKIHTWLYYDGAEIARARLQLAYAAGRLSLAEYRKFAAHICEPVPSFPVKAKDLMALGYEGAALGAAIKRLEKKWIKSGFSEGREMLLSRVIPI